MFAVSFEIACAELTPGSDQACPLARVIQGERLCFHFLLLLLQGHDHAPILGNRIVGCLVDAQVRHNGFRRSMS